MFLLYTHTFGFEPIMHYSDHKALRHAAELSAMRAYHNEKIYVLNMNDQVAVYNSDGLNAWTAFMNGEEA